MKKEGSTGIIFLSCQHMQRSIFTGKTLSNKIKTILPTQRILTNVRYPISINVQTYG